MEMIEDGERDCEDALAVPYARAMGFRDGALTIRDVITGKTSKVEPRLVLNIAGAWADQVQSGLGFNEPMIGGTKGLHIIVQNPSLADALDGRMLYFEADDYRACIVLPLGGDRLFLGATDLRTDDPEDRHCSEEEIDYLFGVMEAVLPEIDFKREDIVYTITGVRPLPKSDGVDAGSISRDHKLHEFPPSDDRPFLVFTLIGGKWTTYRVCAAQIADSVLDHLGMERKADTIKLAIGGGLDFPRGDEAQAAWARDLAARTGLDPKRAHALAWRYGSRATPIAGAETYAKAEIEWICRNERVTRLEDIVLRRTLIAFEGLATHGGLCELADIAGAVLDWPPERIAEEIETTSDLLTDRYRMRLEVV